MAILSLRGRAPLARALALGGVLAPLFCAPPAAALSRIELSLEQAVQQSDAVFVGRVVSRQSRWADESRRWMWTDVTLRVEDGISGAQTGETVTVRYWGGEIGNTRMCVAGLEIPGAGRRYVMMLKPAKSPPGMSPVVGAVDGLFPVTDSADGAVVTTAEGAPVALPSHAPGGAQASGPAETKLSSFTGWLRANVAPLRSRPSALAARPAASAAETSWPGQPVPEEAGAAPAVSPVILPRAQAASAPDAPARTQVASAFLPQTSALDSAVLVSGEIPTDIRPAFKYEGPLTKVPLTFNPLPPSMTPWAGVDQAQMGKWNYYADVFRVLTTPTGTYGWNNGRSDMCGFPSSADRQRVYGSGWDANVLATCLWLSVNGVIVEADIMLNPGVSWSLNDEWIYDGGSANSFRFAVLHELGHALGLDHNFTDYSVMNYVVQWAGPVLTLPMMDDAEAVRRGYPAQAIPRTDVAVYLVNKGAPRSDGTYPDWQPASFPGTAKAGSSFDVSGYHLENVGSQTGNVTVEWYLTAARNYNDTYRHLRTVDYGSLNRFTYFGPGYTTLAVPYDMPAGSYYLHAFIRGDGGAEQSSFPNSNNKAFSPTRITVSQRLASLSVARSTLKPGESTTATVQLYGPGDGVTVYTGTLAASALEYPASVYIPAGTSSATFTVRARSVSTPASVSLHVSYGGEPAEAAVYVVPDHSMADVRRALEAVGGGRILTATEFAFLNVETSGSSAQAVDMRDVTRLARNMAGLDSDL